MPLCTHLLFSLRYLGHHWSRTHVWQWIALRFYALVVLDRFHYPDPVLACPQAVAQRRMAQVRPYPIDLQCHGYDASCGLPQLFSLVRHRLLFYVLVKKVQTRMVGQVQLYHVSSI